MTRFATSAAVTANPIAKINNGHDRKFGAMVTTGVPLTTTPAFTSPMNAMNRPMPIPIARFRSMGMAFKTASRNPVSTRRVMMIPSATTTPIASAHVRWAGPSTSVKATKALRPSPAARAKG